MAGFSPPRSYGLRISLTEACAFRCPYCLPEGPLRLTPAGSLLSSAEIARLTELLTELGVRKVRLTGGEPLARRECIEIVEVLSKIDALEDIALTTNGELLGPLARPLKEAGLRRINVHLDSLKPARFYEITRRSDLGTVLEGLAAAVEAGLDPVKVNCVVMRGVNDDELFDFCEFGARWNVPVRFIELMNTGSAQKFFSERFVPVGELRARLGEKVALTPAPWERGPAPAEEWLVDGGRAVVGFIGSESEPFCGACDRLRLTADGRLARCLYEAEGVPLRQLLRGGAADDALRAVLARAIAEKRSHHPSFGRTGERPFAMAEVGG